MRVCAMCVCVWVLVYVVAGVLWTQSAATTTKRLRVYSSICERQSMFARLRAMRHAPVCANASKAHCHMCNVSRHRHRYHLPLPNACSQGQGRIAMEGSRLRASFVFGEQKSEQSGPG